MTNLYNKRRGSPAQQMDETALLATIRDFLSTCKAPAMLEYGDEAIRLVAGQYCLEVRGGRLWIEAWNDRRNLARRILSVDGHKTGCLDCTIQRFGAATAKLSFLDLDRPQSASKTLRGERQTFAEQFRISLSRQFPGWDITSLSSGTDLQRSLSPVYPRAKLRRGNVQLAAMACATLEDESALLTSALIWHHQVFEQTGPGTHTTLCLFLPESAGTLTAHRLRWLTGRNLQPRIFLFNRNGAAGEVDLQDLGNLKTSVRGYRPPPPAGPELQEAIQRLSTIPGVYGCAEPSGSISLRCKGIEFARLEGSRLLYGIETKQEAKASHTQEVEQLALYIASIPPEAGRPGHYHALISQPERWLEGAVRENIGVIDAALEGSPVHGQVLTESGSGRDVVDLLSISLSGQLAILELKTEEDLRLPLQALDYWVSIRGHAEARELDPFFPGKPIAASSPKLYLVSPALSFHSSNNTVLNYFSPAVDVERVGVSSNWKQEFKVVTRFQGAQVPMSHERTQ